MSVGYSKTPLVKKLGIKENFTIKLFNQPDYYPSLLEDLPGNVRFVEPNVKQPVHFIHYFALDIKSLKKDLLFLQDSLKQDGMIWISWDKTKSKCSDAVNENLVRSEALKLKLVDIKVCALDETWSGLKLVIRKELRNLTYV